MCVAVIVCASATHGMVMIMTCTQVAPAMYATSWFLTLFTNFSALDVSTTQRVWDCFLCGGWQVRDSLLFRF